MVNSTGKRQCKATNSRGEPCQAAAGDSGYCFWHDPAKAAQCRAARSKGGRARHGRHIDKGAGGPVEIRSVADVIALLVRAVNDTLTMEISLQRARVLGYLAGGALKCLEIGDLEERVAELERVLKERKP